MATRTRLIIQKLAGNPKQLFLIDSIGAVLTAIFLGLILSRFAPIFGMPRTVFYSLSLVACVFAAYSLSCLFFVRSNWRSFLSIIMLANFLYCLVTIGLLLYFRQSITIPGLIYFFLELLVISGLLFIEWKVLFSKGNTEHLPTQQKPV